MKQTILLLACLLVITPVAAKKLDILKATGWVPPTQAERLEECERKLEILYKDNVSLRARVQNLEDYCFKPKHYRGNGKLISVPAVDRVDE